MYTMSNCNLAGISFHVIQHHHFNIEIPRICENYYLVVRENSNLNSIGTASQYFAMLHSANASSVKEFWDFLHNAIEVLLSFMNLLINFAWY